MRLLVVDDEQGWRESLVELLEDMNYEVFAVEDGAQALQLLKKPESQFDAVLSDIRMPVMDGMELLREMVRSKMTVPTILITGHGDVKISVEALKLGALDLILKPFPFPILQAALDRLKLQKIEVDRQIELMNHSDLKLRLLVPSRPELVASAVQTLRPLYQPLCEMHQVPSHMIDLCMQEALMNAVIHGNLEIPSNVKDQSWDRFEDLVAERTKTPPYSQRQIRVQMDLDRENLKFSIEDEGKGFNPDSTQRGSTMEMMMQSHGRGLILIRNIMSSVDWNERGNQITMIKNWKES